MGCCLWDLCQSLVWRYCTSLDFLLIALSLKNVNHKVLLFAQCMSVTAQCLLLGDNLNIFVVGLNTSMGHKEVNTSTKKKDEEKETCRFLQRNWILIILNVVVPYWWVCLSAEFQKQNLCTA